MLDARTFIRYGNTCAAADPAAGLAVSAQVVRTRSGRWLIYKMAATVNGRPAPKGAAQVEEARDELLQMLRWETHNP